MATNEEKLRIAGDYARASNACDIDALVSLHAPDAIIWHNVDQIEISVDKSMATLRWLHRKMPDVSFTEVRHVATEEGFVQRAVITGTAPDGSSLRVPSCVVVAMDADGRIVRAEEYLDSSQMAPLLKSP